MTTETEVNRVVPRISARLLAICLFGIVGPISPAAANESAPAPAPTEAAEAEETTATPKPDVSADSGLTGDEIYQRILDNRFSAYIQELEMTSGDRGGNELRTEVDLSYKNYRKKSKRIVSKSIAKYKAPQDVRHLGYLVINKKNGLDDQFIFQPSSRRVRRVNLRGEAVFGTDFSFEDIIPQEFEDGTYLRLADETVSELPCFVVEVIPTEKADSEYSKFVVFVEKEHYVPLRTDYWDKKGTEIKRLLVDTNSLTGYDEADIEGMKEVWIATNQKVRHLKMETWTELVIKSLESKPKLRERDFSERELTASH